MNGNSLMFLHELVGLGFAEIDEGKQGQWQELAAKVPVCRYRPGAVDGSALSSSSRIPCST